MLCKKKYGCANNFLQKGVLVSPFILLNLAADSNPAGENPGRRAGCNFLPEKPVFRSFDYYFKNNQPEEPSGAVPTVKYFYTLCSNKKSAPPTAGSGNFSAIVRRDRVPVVSETNEECIAVVTKYGRMIQDFSLILNLIK